MLPVERAAYLQQLGAALALSVVQLWAPMTTVAILWKLATAPGAFSVASVAAAVMASAAVQVCLFGVCAWFARYRSISGTLAVSMAASMLVAVGIVFGEQFTAQAGVVLFWTTAISAPVGLLIAWDAYRRWRVADLG